MKTLRVVFHDGSLTGAPIACCRVIEALAKRRVVQISGLFQRGGPIERRVRRFSATRVLLPGRASLLNPVNAAHEAVARVFVTPLVRPLLAREHVDLCLYNSAASIRWALRETDPTTPKWLWVHEMPVALRRLKLADAFARLNHHFSRLLAVSDAVKQGLVKEFGIASDRITVFPGTIDSPAATNRQLRSADCLRNRLATSEAAPIVGMVGTLTKGKGVERFVRIAAEIKQHSEGRAVRFVWCGDPSPQVSLHDLKAMTERHGATGIVHHIPFTPDISSLMQQFDLLLLPSYEDSFPLVVLEAAEAKVPAMCFAGSGGAPEFIGDARLIIQEDNPSAAAAQIAAMIANVSLRRILGRRLHDSVVEHYTPEKRARELEAMIGDAFRVSEQ